ncbi:PREDICTED: uncharacterized protein C22orf24 homolog [Odobenus rosmarus divergens]|uniref:Uncharacterized protein C22orf24 homolog n=1 Tax=Odobenus rosmarus divergens TaxID=9708 RepID=A0A9B0GHJ5_ODORO
MATREDETGLLQRSSVWTPTRNWWRRVTGTYSMAGRAVGGQCTPTQFRNSTTRVLLSLALCLAYSRCSINTCRMTECLMSASGCHLGPEEPGRWEESFWSPAMPYISSIFSESWQPAPWDAI